jgi:hypothetical protein
VGGDTPKVDVILITRVENCKLESIGIDRGIFERIVAMAAQMQLKGSFYGSRTALAPRSTPVRARISCVARAEKAASAGVWLPGVDSPSWLEEADLPGNRGGAPERLLKDKVLVLGAHKSDTAPTSWNEGTP